MSVYARRIPRIAALVVTLACIIPGRSWAQEETPSPTPVPLPLTLEEPVAGELDGSAAVAVYTFRMSAGQDAVVTVEADHVVMTSYCRTVTITTAPITICKGGGGGGGDPAVSTVDFIPWIDQAVSDQEVTLELHRPLDGPAAYTLTVYAVTPEPYRLGEALDVTPGDSARFQIYSLSADTEQPFFVTVDLPEEEVDGPWGGSMAYEPYLTNFSDHVALSSHFEILPQLVDFANRRRDGELRTIGHLYSLGGDAFRLLVECDAPYTLYGAEVAVDMLEAESEQTVTVSPRSPLQVFRLEGDNIQGTVRVNSELTGGTEALVMVYAPNARYGTGPQLTSDTGPHTTEVTVDSGDPVYVVIRGISATVTLSWTLAP